MLDYSTLSGSNCQKKHEKNDHPEFRDHVGELRGLVAQRLRCRGAFFNLHLPVAKIPPPSDSVCVFAVFTKRSICTCIDRASGKPKVFAAA